MFLKLGIHFTSYISWSKCANCTNRFNLSLGVNDKVSDRSRHNYTPCRGHARQRNSSLYRTVKQSGIHTAWLIMYSANASYLNLLHQYLLVNCLYGKSSVIKILAFLLCCLCATRVTCNSSALFRTQLTRIPALQWNAAWFIFKWVTWYTNVKHKNTMMEESAVNRRALYFKTGERSIPVRYVDRTLKECLESTPADKNTDYDSMRPKRGK